MKQPMNRRMFLRGAGGAVMAIPFLPSILSKAYASGPVVGPIGKCFMAISTFQGDIWGKNMYPDDALLTQETPYAGRQVRYGALPTGVDAFGDVSWSPVLKAAGSAAMLRHRHGQPERGIRIRGAHWPWQRPSRRLPSGRAAQ